MPTPSWLLIRKAAAVQLGERAGDGKAEAGALVALRELGLDLLEGPAELVQGVLRDADAVVLDVDVDGIAGEAGADGDAAAVGRELGGVLEEVDEDLVEAALVGRHGDVLRRHVDRDGEVLGADLLADEAQRRAGSSRSPRPAS